MTGVAILILGLIVMFPARVVVNSFATSGVAIRGIQGTVWTGSIREASADGIYLSNIEWHLKPLGLFGGRLSYRVTATLVSGFVETDLSIGFGGAVGLSNLNAALPLNLFASAAGVRGLSGSASLTFERLKIVDGLAVVADGTVQIVDLVVPIVGRESLGGYKADFFTQDNGITASIEDTDGVIDLAGSLQVRDDRTFEFIGQVVAKPETPQNIRQQLQFLPSGNEQGQKELRLEGVL
jgi:hypothetical protein